MIKKITALIIIVLALMIAYLLYKLWIEDDWSKRDYWLLIIVLAVGSVNSEIIMRQKRKRDDH